MEKENFGILKESIRSYFVEQGAIDEEHLISFDPNGFDRNVFEYLCEEKIIVKKGSFYYYDLDQEISRQLFGEEEKKKKKRTFIIALALLLLIGIPGVYFGTKFFKEKAAEKISDNMVQFEGYQCYIPDDYRLFKEEAGDCYYAPISDVEGKRGYIILYSYKNAGDFDFNKEVSKSTNYYRSLPDVIGYKNTTFKNGDYQIIENKLECNGYMDIIYEAYKEGMVVTIECLSVDNSALEKVGRIMAESLK